MESPIEIKARTPKSSNWYQVLVGQELGHISILILKKNNDKLYYISEILIK